MISINDFFDPLFICVFWQIGFKLTSLMKFFMMEKEDLSLKSL